MTKRCSASAIATQHWSQALDFESLESGEISIVANELKVVHPTTANDDDSDMQKLLTRRLTYSGFTAPNPIFHGQSVQAMFVMPGANSFDPKETCFNNDGDLLVTITYRG